MLLAFYLMTKEQCTIQHVLNAKRKSYKRVIAHLDVNNAIRAFRIAMFNIVSLERSMMQMEANLFNLWESKASLL